MSPPAVQHGLYVLAWVFFLCTIPVYMSAAPWLGLHQAGLSDPTEFHALHPNAAPEFCMDTHKQVRKEQSETERLAVPSELRFEVHVSDRKLHVFDGRELMASYPVAVGRAQWPTRRGRWNIYEVVWNPWWHPPDQEWAWYKAIMAPGDPDNPLGRAQLIYDAPRSIHGTNAPESIGKAVSHGSIRVCNETAMKLVRLVMEYAGIERDEAWFQEIRSDPSRNVRFRIHRPVPIRVL